jgi:hypothetical protein
MSLYVSRRPPTQLNEFGSEPRYDLALVSVGFEERSVAVPTSIAPPGLGIGLEFADRHEDAYNDNYEAIAMRGYQILLPEPDIGSFVAQIGGWFESAATRRPISEADPFRVAVDISSMTRTRIAAIIEACYAQEIDAPALIDLLYAPATYRPSSPPPASWVQATPVTEHFAGWDPDAAKPLLAVVGLGYEPNAAEGVVDYLTPDESVILIPRGRDPHYREDVESVNSEVLAKANIRLEYAVEDPYRLMLELERLVLARVGHSRILFVPLGPKIFAAACMLVAQRLHPMVSVWRFSAGVNDEPRPAVAAGPVCGIRLTTRPEETSGFDAGSTGSRPGSRASN